MKLIYCMILIKITEVTFPNIVYQIGTQVVYCERLKPLFEIEKLATLDYEGDQRECADLTY